MSVSAVSKALNNDKSISVLTRERVCALASEWNYVRNETARHFKQSKSFIIGIILPELIDQFYLLAINGVEKVALEEQYNVILTQSHESFEMESKILDMMIRNRVDGVIASISKQTEDTAAFKRLEAMGIPVVYIARMPKDPACNYVTSNNFEGAFKGTEFLIKKGHTRIAHIKPPNKMYISQIRHEGYAQALQKHAVEYDPQLVKDVDLTNKSTFAAVEQLMKLKQPPTAILTFKNYITLNAMQVLRKKFPAQSKKIDFVGFGNLPLLEYLEHKTAASIEENPFEIGTTVARLLMQMIKDRSEETEMQPKHIQIACKLVVTK